MKANQLRERNVAELQRTLEDAYKELFNLRFQAASGQLSDTERVRVLRKDIARIKTVLRERELAAQRGTEGA